MAAFSVAASTAPVIRIRTLATNSISIAMPLAEPAGVDAASNSGATIAGHEADLLLGGIVMLGPQRSSLSDQLCHIVAPSPKSAGASASSPG